MIRCFILTIVCLLVLVSNTPAQQQFQEDVVYLKNGSIIRGVIIHQVPDEPLKIQIKGGSIMVIQMTDILRIAKEMPMQPSIHRSEKDPALALVLSFLIVGAGQIYTEEYEQAFIHWLIAGISIGLVYGALEDNVRVLGVDVDPDNDNDNLVGGIFLGLTNWLISMISAPIAAQEMNKKNRASQSVTLINDRLFLEPCTSPKSRGAMLSLRF